MTKANLHFALKNNAIRLAQEHRENCEDIENCDISLTLLMVLLDTCGIELTMDERTLFV